MTNALLYLTTVLVWGTTWWAITFQLGNVPLEVSLTYRFILAAGILFLWCKFRGLNLKLPLKAHKLLMTQGLFMFSLNYIAAYAAGQYITSGLNAIGFSMILVFNIINASIFLNTRIILPLFAGASLGLIGLIFIFWPSIISLDLTDSTVYGLTLSLFAAAIASFGNIVVTRNQKEKIPITEGNAYAMGYGALWLLLIALLQGKPILIDTSAPYIVSLLYLSVFGTIVAFWCYLKLIRSIGSGKAAYSLVLTPMVALVISTFFEDFTWSLNIFFGIGLILLGNVIILARKPTKQVSFEKTDIPQVALKEAT